MVKQVSGILLQTNMMDNEKNILAKTEMSLTEDLLFYTEKSGASCSVSFQSDSIILSRNAESTSEIVLFFNGDGKATITSDLGRLYFESRLLNYQKTPEKITIEYKLFSENESIFHSKFEWFFK